MGPANQVYSEQLPELETTADWFFNGDLSLDQPKSGPRTAIDAFFLAAAIPEPVRGTLRVIEAGAGNGAVSLALALRVAEIFCVGVELEARLVHLAQSNARKNKLHERVQFVQGDVTKSQTMNTHPLLVREGFDHAIANPPYYFSGSARQSEDEIKGRAYVHTLGDLDSWIRFLTTATSAKGSLTLIHLPENLNLLLEVLDGRFGDLALFPLYPHVGKTASRIIIQGIKGSRGGTTLHQGLVLHETNGQYTEEANKILRDCGSLKLR